MKAPSFWNEKNSIQSLMLAPFSLFWRAGGALRRVFANPYKSKIPVICIGNVVAGGSGKTPTALVVAEILKAAGHNPVFVTRGYGGHITDAVRVDTEKHSSADVGDEALLLARAAPVYVGQDRVAAIKLAEQNATHIILDDGLQNPNIIPDISLLVTDGATGIGNGHIIPAGPLREKLADALQRVQAVVMVGEDQTELAAQLNKPILQAYIDPVLPAGFPLGASFLAFAGIGRPEKFYETCRKAGLTLAETRDFPDHHIFTAAELSDLQNRATKLNARLLTTEKDWVRLPPALQGRVETLPVHLAFSIPAAVREILRA